MPAAVLRDWSYAAWPSGEPYSWEGTTRAREDMLDFHVDLGCGTAKKGRIGVDRLPAPGVDVVCDLESLSGTYEAPKRGITHFHSCLPFYDDSIESIIAHHVLEHVGDGLLPLLDECWRVLRDGDPLRIITPLMPSYTAVTDPTHKRYFTEDSFDHLLAYRTGDFARSPMQSRWTIASKDCSPLAPPEKRWTPEDRREMRLTLLKVVE